MKYLSHNIFLYALAASIFVGMLFVGYYKSKDLQDPMAVLLEIHSPKNENFLKADFPANGPNPSDINSYTGPKSAALFNVLPRVLHLQIEELFKHP